MKHWHFQFLTAYPRRSILRILALALGCLGFQLTLVLKDRLSDHVQIQKRNLLGASHVISARQEIPLEDIHWVQNHQWVQSWSHGWEYPAMARVRTFSKLIQVHAIDEKYPLIGKIQTPTGMPLGSALKEKSNSFFCDQRFFEIFQPKDHENFQIGDHTFQFAGVIQTNLQLNQGFSQLLPSVFIEFGNISKNGFPMGSTIWDRILINTTPEAETAFLKVAEERFLDPNIQVKSASQNAQDNLRPLLLLTDYLGIIGTISFLLILIAEYFYSLHSFEQSKKDYALLQVLGMTNRTFFILLFLKNVFIQIVACLLCWMVIQSLAPQLGWIVQDFLPIESLFHPSAMSFLILFFVLLLGSSLSLLAQYLMFQKISAADFLSEKNDPSSAGFLISSPLLFLIPGIAGMSFYLSKSIKLSVFFILTLILLSLVAPLCLLFLSKVYPKIPIASFALKKSLRKLTRQKFLPSLFLGVFIVFGFFFGLSAFARWTIFQQIKNDPSVSTARFLFDIQQEQEPDLQRYFQNAHGEISTSNLVRGKITSINEKPFEKVDLEKALSREEETDLRFRNRGINLTSRSQMNESEQITQGEWFGQINTNQQYPELSLEEKYAQRIGVQLQDKIEFDIQGVPLTGIVTSLRKVRWTSFQPNFFIIVQPGFLEDAPQTFVALLKNFDKEILLQFEKEWLAKNANVSVIDVAEVFSAAQKMVKGAQQAILLMFFLLSLTVSLVLGSILIIQSESQKKEVELLSFLGVPTSMGKISIFYEYCILLFFGILVVSLSTWGLGFIFIHYVLGW